VISDVELAVMTAQTKAFIAADFEIVSITPRVTRTPDGAGGWTEIKGAPLPNITCRLIPQSDKVPEAMSLDGRRAAPEYVLMAMPGEDIQEHDTFVWRGATYQIAQVHRKPEYELKADVVLYVGKP
jgi:hypothetical protein